MVKIKDTIFYNSPIPPSFTSYSPSEIMEDKTVATDNNTLNPVEFNFEIYYKIQTEGEDPREKRKFLEDIFYSPENLVTVEDLQEGIIYENMMLQRLTDWETFEDGFIVKIGFKQALLTQKAEAGQTSEAKQQRNMKYVEKPLKTVTVGSAFLPDMTLGALEGMGIKTDTNGLFNLECLDFGNLENIKNNISESILTPLGDKFLNFSILVDGTLEILDGAGQYLAAGQNLLGNVELLANMIPGVDFSLKLLPMTEKAIDAYFDIFSLGKDWQMVVGEIKGGLEQLGN
ncbi:hypothetical protein [Fusobacterium ulcerans]|uniref:Uncharacterized protein n=1 Tax=Fusobacterium ulcerans 12-1B TaxID=457404 RepID=H1PVT8_9FUSO|nr:hypothetical protein [Fusobacterium ulcerans]EHO79792.1 hypothetical protein HMPREF0402_02531 [Fusobacterium ulcerans 12-1B]